MVNSSLINEHHAFITSQVSIKLILPSITNFMQLKLYNKKKIGSILSTILETAATEVKGQIGDGPIAKFFP